MKTIDIIRLRIPVPLETAEMLDGRPRLLKGAQLAQPALIPAQPLPLRVACWDDFGKNKSEALHEAVEVWNSAINKHTNLNQAFIEAKTQTCERIDVIVESLEMSSGGSLQHNLSLVDEMAVCKHRWDKSFQVYSVDDSVCEIYLKKNVSLLDLKSVLLHELGHALLLGHSDWRGSLMYPEHGGVTRPSKKLCKIVEEIWT